MKSIIRITLASAAIAIISGCAGTNFKRPEPSALELGRSTSAQITQVMGGTASQSGEVLRNNEKLKSLRYAYADAMGSGKYPDVIPARAIVFLTHNDLLVAEEFTSSFPNDATDFDETKVSSIIKGKTTKADVLSILGNPNGRGIFPFIKNKGESANIYSYSHAKGNAFNMKFYSKILIISFDTSGIVSDIEFVSNGEK